ALQAKKLEPTAGLKGEGLRLIGGPGRNRLRNLLVVSETALALVLLVGAGLVINSFARLLRVNLGFRPQHVITFQLALAASRYPDPSHQATFYQQLWNASRPCPACGPQEWGRICLSAARV